MVLSRKVQPAMPYMSLGVAPMEGVTDFPMRLWLWLLGRPDFFWTPFLRVTHTFPHRSLPLNYIPELIELRDLCPYPLIPQIMASDALFAARAAELILPHAPYVDLNCGCPAPTVVGNGAGSSLLIDPNRLRSFVEQLSKDLTGRLSIKTRLGFASQQEWPAILATLADLNLVHITVHGRSREDKYLGQANWDAISYATTHCSTPIIVSGDIFSLNHWQRLQEKIPMAYAAIAGRGSLRLPWLFHFRKRGVETTSVSAKFLQNMLQLFYYWQALNAERPEFFIKEMAPIYYLEGHRFISDTAFMQAELQKAKHLVDQLQLISTAPRIWLGRLKMLWQSLRTSLPDSLATDRELLRSATFCAFNERFEYLSRSVCQPMDALTIRHNALYDYKFASPEKS